MTFINVAAQTYIKLVYKQNYYIITRHCVVNQRQYINVTENNKKRVIRPFCTCSEEAGSTTKDIYLFGQKQTNSWQCCEMQDQSLVFILSVSMQSRQTA